MPEWLACEYIAEVNFNERYGRREKCIAQRDAGVREGAGVDDYERNSVALGALHPADQFMLRVALAGEQVMAFRASQDPQL